MKSPIYSEIRNQKTTENIKSTFINNSYSWKDHLNIIIKLEGGMDGVWGGLSQSKRRAIRKGRKNGVIIRSGESKDEISNFYELLRSTYEYAGVPLVDISLFTTAYESLSNRKMLQFYVCEYDDEIIGGGYFPVYNNKIYEWYITSRKDIKGTYPGELVTWAPIEYGIEHGLSLFDFMGAGDPNQEYSVRNFKKGFGGEVVNLGRYDAIHKEFLFFLSKIGLHYSDKVRRISKQIQN